MASEPLLAAWDECVGRTHTDVAVRLLEAASVHFDRGSLWDMPIGERDRLLLELRCEQFGEDITLRTKCPRCEDDLELEATLAEFRRTAPVDSPLFDVDDDSYSVRFGLPTSADLAHAMRAETETARREALWHRCVSCERHGSDLDICEVPDWLVAQVEEAMASADPQAVCTIEVVCPTCGHDWHADFDIVSVLWTEIDVYIMRLMVDVHELASAYGWTEADVFDLSSRRRQFYLDQI